MPLVSRVGERIQCLGARSMADRRVEQVEYERLGIKLPAIDPGSTLGDVRSNPVRTWGRSPYA